jgi:hypothetical protein
MFSNIVISIVCELEHGQTTKPEAIAQPTAVPASKRVKRDVWPWASYPDRPDLQTDVEHFHNNSISKGYRNQVMHAAFRELKLPGYTYPTNAFTTRVAGVDLLQAFFAVQPQLEEFAAYAADTLQFDASYNGIRLFVTACTDARIKQLVTQADDTLDGSIAASLCGDVVLLERIRRNMFKTRYQSVSS